MRLKKADVEYEDFPKDAFSNKINADVRNGTFCLKEVEGTPKTYKFMKKLKEKGDDVLDEFFNEYAKAPKCKEEE